MLAETLCGVFTEDMSNTVNGQFRIVSQLQSSFRTTVVREQARSDFGETVGAVLDSISAFPLIPAPVRAVIQAVRTTVVSVARAVWDFFF